MFLMSQGVSCMSQHSPNAVTNTIIIKNIPKLCASCGMYEI